jgi:hypothetical protein
MMTITRRKFLRAGALVAVSAAVPLKSVLVVAGQEARQTEFGGSPVPLRSQDPLAYYTRSAFSSHLNSIFRLHTGYSTVDVTLVRVTDLAPEVSKAETGKECFSLLFVGESVALPQNTYLVEHQSLGSFRLFLVPGGPDQHGAQSYVATINRIPYGPGLSDGPARSLKPSDRIKPGEPSKPTKMKPAQPPTPGQKVTPGENTTPPQRAKPEGKRIGDGFQGAAIDQ